MPITYDEARSNAQKIADDIIKTRVLRGIKLLEERIGPDWVDRIDPASLCMQSTSMCILGQVYDQEDVGSDWDFMEGYFKAIRSIDGDVETNPGRYGFNLPADDDDADDEQGDYHWDELRAGWLIAMGHDVE